MADLLRLLVDIFSVVWPFRVVKAWQRGVYYILGRSWREVGPGVWPVVPWFTDVIPVSVVRSAWGTPLQTITLRDGRVLAFSAMATVQVADPQKALNEVEEWQETVMETVSGVLADRLATVDPDRFDPAHNKRRNLIEELRREVEAQTVPFGVKVLALRFTNFALGIRAYRLLQDRATYSETTIGAV